MLGWNITVSTQTPQERDLNVIHSREDSILASWSVGIGGLNWVSELQRSGKAEELLGGGYPCRYVIRAADVLPLLADGPPAGGSTIHSSWMHPERMAACRDDQMLTVDAWDQS
ncbi:hypothetical protein ABZZ17_09220 [Streptomyces sp. NPDC006512]|uniref:hypothetical protein n=1 Tax=Streptomyces sp. NPDC006512 TaxID=3154307 RepID=UPI0033B5C33A